MIFKDKIKKHLGERYNLIDSIEETDKSLIVKFKFGEENTPLEYNFAKDYFRVITVEEENKAEMYLYGYIGQDFWWDDELKEESLTDLEFIKSLKELEKKYDRIDIRINSPGGSVFHGDPIITAINKSTAEIHTYIDGMAASMAFDIWLVGDVRHVSINGKAMCHATSTFEFGTAQDMRNAADRLDVFDNSAIATFAHVTGMEVKEIRELFYDDYQDHWMTSTRLKELGLVEEIEDYKVEEPEEKSAKELIKESIKTETIREKEELTSEEMIQRLKDEYGDKLTLEIAEAEETEDDGESQKQSSMTLDFAKVKMRMHK